MSKLNQQILVLNKSWLAIQLCTIRKALILLYQGYAKVVDKDYQVYGFNDWSELSKKCSDSTSNFICSPSFKIKIPKIIVLLGYDKLPKRKIRFSRKNIFQRDNFTCQYCNVKPTSKKEAINWLETNVLNLDHVIPKSKGGKTIWQNVVASCFKCNVKKGNRTLGELGWELKKIPRNPEKSNYKILVPIKIKPQKEWLTFIDLAYWNVTLENDLESKYEN